MTIYPVDHFFEFFNAFNTDAIKDIQLINGGFGANYGGRLTSVVDLTGKTGDRNHLQFGAGINLLSANAYFEMPFSRWGTLFFAGRRSYTDLIQSSLYNHIYRMLTGNHNANTMGGPVQAGPRQR